MVIAYLIAAEDISAISLRTGQAAAMTKKATANGIRTGQPILAAAITTTIVTTARSRFVTDAAFKTDPAFMDRRVRLVRPGGWTTDLRSAGLRSADGALPSLLLVELSNVHDQVVVEMVAMQDADIAGGLQDDETHVLETKNVRATQFRTDIVA